ncbi:MAG: hypothetical protein J6B51_07055, partial [Clostridia bacterium]|nr:hypothetical protein [Clostridia bacterium]
MSYISKAKDRTFDYYAEKNAAAVLRSYGSISAQKEDVRLFELMLSRLFSVKKRIANVSGGGEEVFWKYGVSGDFPIVLVRTDETNIRKCKAFIKAFILLKNADIPCEMVFCFSEGGSYERRIWNGLRSYFREFSKEDLFDRRGGAFLANIVDVSDFNAFRAVADFYIDLSKNNGIRPRKLHYPKPLPKSVEPKKIFYRKKMGLGGFIDGGYGIDDKSSFHYRPVWSHVLANPSFGTVVTESDAGFAFARNSSLNKITPWSGDPVCGCGGERLTFTEDGQIFDLLSNSSVSFFNGWAEYRSTACGADFTVKIFVPESISAKIIVVSVVNGGAEKTVDYSVDIIMNSSEKRGGVIREITPKTVYFTNPYNSIFPEGCSFLSGEKTGEGRASFSVGAGEKKTSFFVLGYEKNKACAESLAASLDIYTVYGELEKIEQTRPCIKIRTPNESLDLFYNTFLLSQIVNSRIYARSGFYQCGGAFGFRDQLQDCICISSVFPRLLKRQIIRSASRQFIEGDVFHWWHDLPSGPKGARTRFS